MYIWQNGKNSKYTKIATIKKKSITSYKKKGLKEGKKYYFKVRAYKKSKKTKKYGSYSEILQAQTKKRLSKVKVSVNTSSKRYTGKAVKTTVSIKDGKNTLKYKKDYTISYKNNVNLGTATVTVKGKGNYTGTIKKNFKIVIGKTNNVKVKSQSVSDVTLGWTRDPAVTGYEIYMATSKSGKYSKIATITKNSVTSYKKTKLTKNKIYYFKIRAYKIIKGKKQYGAYSNIVSGTPKENVVGNLNIVQSMIKDNTLTIENKTYLNVTISQDVKEDSQINLNNITIKGKLTLNEPQRYRLNISNTNLSNMEIVKVTSKAYNASNVYNQMIDGPTVNFENCSNIKKIDINGNIEINGTNTAETININSGNEISLGIASNEVIVNSNPIESVIAVNKDVKNIVNKKDNVSIMINSNINDITNNGRNSKIMIATDKKVSNLVNNAENTVISGKGNIEKLTISESSKNAKIFVKTTTQPVVKTDDSFIVEEKDLFIQSVEPKGQGNVTFTLNKQTSKKLTLSDVSIYCGRGSETTIFSIESKDNKTYNLTTSYYKDGIFGLYVTLPNGNIISKDFKCEYSNPTVNKSYVIRTAKDKAELELYGVDEGGYLYYVLEAPGAQNINEAHIKAKGTKVQVKTEYNKIDITSGLNEGKSYELYYIIEGFYKNTSSVKGPIEVSSKIQEVDKSDILIEYAAEESCNTFVIRLNKVPEKKLVLSDFSIKCPTESKLTISGAKFTTSADRLTYYLKVPDNYGHKDNKYTVEVNVGSKKISKSFVSHFAPPVITGEKITRTGKNEAKLTFNSDEPGKMYYGIFEWNRGIYVGDSTTPLAEDVLKAVANGTLAKEPLKGKEKALVAGPNDLIVDLSNIEITKTTRIWVLFVDNVGNYRNGFVSHFGSIPEYVGGGEEEDKSTLKITTFNATSKSIRINFNEEIGYMGNSDIELQGSGLPARITYSTSLESKSVYIELLNCTLSAGKYKIIITPTDSKDNVVTLEYEFEIK